MVVNKLAPIPIITTVFTSRMFHSSAYDKNLDVVYNTFGLSNGGIPQNDLIIYFPQNDSFVKKSDWLKSPSARYSHFSCVVDSKLIIFGGIKSTTFKDFAADASNDVWSYDTGNIFFLILVENLWTKLKAFGSIPPGLEDPAVTIAENSFSRRIYVFGGRYVSPDGISISRSLFSYDLGIY